MNILITGCLGQDGSYLTEHMIQNGHTVWGITRRRSSDALSYGHLSHLRDNSNFHLIHGDINDSSFMNEIISSQKPDRLFHLAAQSHVHHSFSSPMETFETDATATLIILDAIKKWSPKTKVYIANTSELFGGDNCPEKGYNENSPFHPKSPYAVAKLSSYWMGEVYKNSYNLFVTNGILFNHSSPRRGLDFVEAKIAHTCREIFFEDKTIKLKLGNIYSKRDIGHAKTYVKAMNKMLDLNEPQNFVISTGETHTIKEMIDCLSEYKGYDFMQNVVISPDLFRPNEVPYLLGDSSKAKKELGIDLYVPIKNIMKEIFDCENK